MTKQWFKFKHKTKNITVDLPAADVIDAAGKIASMEHFNDFHIAVLYDPQQAEDLELVCARYPAFVLPNNQIVYTLKEVEEYLQEYGVGDYVLL